MITATITYIFGLLEEGHRFQVNGMFFTLEVLAGFIYYFIYKNRTILPNAFENNLVRKSYLSKNSAYEAISKIIEVVNFKSLKKAIKNSKYDEEDKEYFFNFPLDENLEKYFENKVDVKKVSKEIDEKISEPKTFLKYYLAFVTLLQGISPIPLLGELTTYVHTSMGLIVLVIGFVCAFFASIYSSFGLVSKMKKILIDKVDKEFKKQNELLKCLNEKCLIDSRIHQWGENKECPHCSGKEFKKNDYFGYDIFTSPVKSKTKVLLSALSKKVKDLKAKEDKDNEIILMILKKLNEEANKRNIKKIKKQIDKGVEIEYFLNQVDLKSGQIISNLDNIHISSLEKSIKFQKEEI